ncbi:SRPBCC family protein [Staphylococcus warneri]|uniref:SRPBCC family protein n=1 Tax=Staphylococcus warneri TaxID=1292 RepID=UPI001A8D1B8E|nr:SRPBCC domain-containing protein [Staphylococcus warneri]MBO0377321.1 SRPBCC domain-containing protein [Staphylococcus warneri]
MTIKVEKNKIIFSRTFTGTIHELFNAYTQEDLFKQWFHPEGASTKVFEFNVEEGGHAFFAIHTPDMTSYTRSEYKKIEKPNYIEYLDFFATPEGDKDPNMPGMHITIEFEEKQPNQTTVTSTSVLPSKEAAQQALDMGGEEGMNSTLDQLEKLLKS